MFGAEVGSYFFLDEIPILITLSAKIHTLVICRVRYTMELAHLVYQFKLSNKRVLFDIDDFVFIT